MPNPTPIYRVSFNGNFLPGYVQTDDQPVVLRSVINDILNRDGASQYPTGTGLRKISLTFHVLSRLGGVSTGLQHLDDCKAQYRTALAYITRISDAAPLMIGDQTKYLMGVPTDVSAPLTAGESRRIKYSVGFDVQPWYYDGTAVTDTFTADDTATLLMTDTRRTYPSFSVPSGVTGFTATHAASGKAMTFTRGAVSGTVVIDCATLQVDASGVNAQSTMGTLDFGMFHDAGAGTMSIVITGFAGAGTVTVSIRERTEL